VRCSFAAQMIAATSGGRTSLALRSPINGQDVDPDDGPGPRRRVGLAAGEDVPLIRFGEFPHREWHRAGRLLSLPLARPLNDEFGLPSYVKTSGSKGFHILIPLDGEGDAESVWRFAHGAGAVLVKRHPHILTQEFIKADRGDRIFVDTGRNLPGATFAAVYAVRAKPGAPISAPCTWQTRESTRNTPTKTKR